MTPQQFEQSEDISTLVGRVPTRIEQTEDTIEMHFRDGSRCEFYHVQDCCESVDIEDVNGDWEDLIGQKLMVAECRSSERWIPDDEVGEGIEEWTFYTFRSVKGSVDVRWFGTSNGYYSTSVCFHFSSHPQ